MLVAVTGPTGHVGANLVRSLLQQGRTVRAVVREGQAASLAGLDIQRVTADVRDTSAVERALDGAEVVFHLAVAIAVGWGDPRQVHDVNIKGTRNVIAACRRGGVRRLVHYSSIHAFAAEPRAEVIDEGRPAALRDDDLPYDFSKATSEQAVLDAVNDGLDAIVINPTAILGPHDYAPSPMGQVLLDLYHRRLRALLHGGFNWVDVRDVIQATLKAEAIAAAGSRYLLAGQWLSLPDLAKLVQEVTGVEAPSWVAPMWMARLGAPLSEAWCRLRDRDPHFTSESLRVLRNHRHISHDKARRELGYEPRPLKETLSDTFAWFEAAGFLKAP